MRLDCQQNNLIDTLEIEIFLLLFLTKQELMTGTGLPYKNLDENLQVRTTKHTSNSDAETARC